MAETERLDSSVLVVGGGPVGLVVAIELGRRGIPCVVLNEPAETARHPKANAIGARTMEHFRRIGVAAPIRAAGLGDDHPTDVAYFTSLTGLELARLRMPCRTEALAMARAGEGPWPTAEPPHRCSQIFLERALYARAAGLASVDLRFGWRFLGFREEADHVVGTAEEVATGRRLEIRARYLAGCDGGSSTVRRQLAHRIPGRARRGAPDDGRVDELVLLPGQARPALALGRAVLAVLGGAAGHPRAADPRRQP